VPYPAGFPVITMTFDDGPHPVWTPRVLEALDRAVAKATFFVIGPRAREHPELVREIARRGHEVGFHCGRHVRHTDLGPAELREDTARGLEDLRIAGARPRLWRPPWGVTTEDTFRTAREHNLEVVLWTLDTHDWRGDAAEEMLGSIGPDLRAGGVILMHDGLGPGATREGCGETVRLVGMLADRIRALGCEPGPLSGAREVAV
jgi:peptidoglycan/xylan/chitin deacetylase (PgdA/CDA1 family)